MYELHKKLKFRESRTNRNWARGLIKSRNACEFPHLSAQHTRLSLSLFCVSCLREPRVGCEKYEKYHNLSCPASGDLTMTADSAVLIEAYAASRSMNFMDMKWRKLIKKVFGELLPKVSCWWCAFYQVKCLCYIHGSALLMENWDWLLIAILFDDQKSWLMKRRQNEKV